MNNIRMQCAIVGLAALAVGAPIVGQDLREKLAAAKQSAAANEQVLRGYTWIEKVELSRKGEVKNTKVSSCRYGPDGTVQKTPVVEPPPPEKKRGLKGKAIAKKTAEMKDELDRSASLVHRYVPPSSENIQTVMTAGAASLAQAGPGRVTLKFQNYWKPNDALSLTFDSAVKSLRQIDVTTWLDDPSQTVTLHVIMQSLADGTDYPAAITLTIPSSDIEVRITNSNYQKLAATTTY